MSLLQSQELSADGRLGPGQHLSIASGINSATLLVSWVYATVILWKRSRNMRVLVILACLAVAPAAAAERVKTAVFDIELIDTSQEAERGIRDDQTLRLALVSDELRKLLQASPQLQLVDIKPMLDEIHRKEPLYKCNGCAENLAQALGADLLVSGVVQKTSNLILNFAVTVKDARSGKLIRAGQVDIRGNTDESWLRGIRWLVKNRLLLEPLSLPL